ncbi:MAG TPA: hypothetical protein VG227_08320 [Caulobacteraceae bacterium]|nr:hypothetical protein [Caulobacteraceae bacterium]
MRLTHKATLVGLSALGALVTAPAAFAGCGGAPIQPASYLVGSNDAQLIRAALVTPANLGVNGIVGLWSVSLVSGGAQIDWGYSEWHSDGTEIMNSGGHTPASGNFCLGVWRQSGPNTYHLKHYPLAYDPTTGNLMFKIILTEDVTVDQTGNNFTGTFTEDLYDPTGVTLEHHIPGTISGHRVLPN